jgi:chemotaxis protein methyltransferase CheR
MKLESSPQLTEQNYAFLRDHLYRESGLVLDAGKHYLLESRLLPIVKRNGLGTLNDLCGILQKNPPNHLYREVVEAMTTNETMFFRDSALWEDLRSTILPELIGIRKQTRRLRFWSAASSSGQEAHSLAIALLEMGLAAWDIQILGTDLSQQMVERAQKAQYSQLEVNRGLPTPLLVKYFARDGLHWRVKDEARRWLRFQQLDLRKKLDSFGPFDIVFCRNVLIYFDVPTKQKILKEIRQTIFKGGYLVLGSAETTLNVDATFVRRPVVRASFYQAGGRYGQINNHAKLRD